jgi:hypothetical protein
MELIRQYLGYNHKCMFRNVYTWNSSTTKVTFTSEDTYVQQPKELIASYLRIQSIKQNSSLLLAA